VYTRTGNSDGHGKNGNLGRIDGLGAPAQTGTLALGEGGRGYSFWPGLACTSGGAGAGAGGGERAGGCIGGPGVVHISWVS
jgi:hypothetical protein